MTWRRIEYRKRKVELRDYVRKRPYKRNNDGREFVNYGNTAGTLETSNLRKMKNQLIAEFDERYSLGADAIATVIDIEKYLIEQCLGHIKDNDRN